MDFFCREFLVGLAARSRDGEDNLRFLYLRAIISVSLLWTLPSNPEKGKMIALERYSSRK